MDCTGNINRGSTFILTKVFFTFFVLFFCFFSYFPRPVIAYQFIDDFSPINPAGWNISTNGGLISTTSDDTILSSQPSTTFPYIVSNDGIVPLGDSEIEIRFTLNGSSNYGSGLGLSYVFPPNIMERDMLPSDILFQVWMANSLTFSVWTSLCPESDRFCIENTYREISPARFNLGTYHILKIVSTSGFFEAYIDGVFIGRYYSNSGRSVKYIWAGNPQKTNTVTTKPSVLLDYLNIIQTDDTPIVVLPGFGGSWDVEAILNGTSGTKWEIPYFVKNYDGIINSFKNAGYVEGTDLFVFPYDWRKPLDGLADDLKTFIDSKNFSGKINLVGHSMGGLVARSYAQKYGTTNIDQVLTAGSPHLGVLDMYGLWEGAKIWDGSWWQKALLEIASEIHRNQGETKVSAIRRNAPSIIDLFPIFPFLVLDGNLINIESMVEKNNYLKTLNDGYLSVVDKITPYWSDDIASTKNRIAITLRGLEDVIQEKWIDGKPIPTNPFSNTAGDGTVTKESAVGQFGVGVRMTGWHGDLLANVDNNKKILTNLGLDPTYATSSASDNRKNAFVALLRSPGKLVVCNDQQDLCGEALGGMYLENEKLFILPGYDQENLKVKVNESGLGIYKLYLGNIDESPDWQVRDGNLTEIGQIDTYNIESSGENISVKQQNVISFLGLTDKLYGDSDFGVTATASSGLTVTYEATGGCSVSNDIVHILEIGNCNITAHQYGNNGYFPAIDVVQSFNITKGKLIVKADDKQRDYSDPDPVFTYETSWLEGYTGSPTCSATTTSISPAGSYPISCSIGSLASSNFDFEFVDAVLKVEQENAKLSYIGQYIAFAFGKKNKASIQLGTNLWQEQDGYPGNIKLANVFFEVINSSGSRIVSQKVSVDKFGMSWLKVNSLSPGEYKVKIWLDPENKYWQGGEPKEVEIRVIALGLFDW